jgi:hypothetical protein
VKPPFRQFRLAQVKPPFRQFRLSQMKPLDNFVLPR